jgi:hypothetical protein
MTKTNEPLFTESDVISTYTDGQAIEDGGLVAINHKDRVTRSVWEYLVEKGPKDSDPPNRWPVDLMAWMAALSISGADLIAGRKAVALSLGLIGTHRDAAKRTFDENTDGGIYKLYVILDGKEMIQTLSATMPPEPTAKGGVYSTLWLLPNEETGGITLMFPEDY